MEREDEIDVSVVVPVYNEQENVKPLSEEIKTVLESMDVSYEILFVDDGSTDSTVEILESLPDVKVVKLQKNFGQSAAMQAGFDYAEGDLLVTMDGDMQDDPANIPDMIEKLERGQDVICGWRHTREDSFSKRIFSRLSNWLRRRLLGEEIHDSGCSLRVYKREVARSLKLQGEMHRYIPALLNWRGFNVSEVKVTHRPRGGGETKYGLKRLVKGGLDLMFVTFWYRYSASPLHLFGTLGGLLAAPGFLISLWLGIERIFLGSPLGDRPLFTLALIMIILGIQMFTLGVLAEYISRVYYETVAMKPYVVEEVTGV
ncbi:MAG: glycosyltransferase family 2 protein [Candidatus Thorarchaeota archaeon]